MLRETSGIGMRGQLVSVSREALRLALTDRSTPRMGASLFLLFRGEGIPPFCPQETDYSSENTARSSDHSAFLGSHDRDDKAIPSHPSEASTPLPHDRSPLELTPHLQASTPYLCLFFVTRVCLCQGKSCPQPALYKCLSKGQVCL